MTQKRGGDKPRPYIRKISQEAGLVLSPVLDILHALAELVVGQMHEGLGFTELALDAGLILRISAIDEGRQPFGHQVHFVAEPFDQYPAIPFAFLDPILQFFELFTHCQKTVVDPLKPSIDRPKTRIKAPV